MKRKWFQRLFSRSFSAVIPTRLLVGKQIYKIKSEVIYEQANDNQTALIQATKRKQNANQNENKQSKKINLQTGVSVTHYT